MPGFPKSSRPQKRDQNKGLAQKAQLQGAQRIQELIRQNQQLPAADRAALVESEKAKGNDFFRCAWAQGWQYIACLALGLPLCRIVPGGSPAPPPGDLHCWVTRVLHTCMSTYSRSCLQAVQTSPPAHSPVLTPTPPPGMRPACWCLQVWSNARGC